MSGRGKNSTHGGTARELGVHTCNSCRLCAPLGAALAFKGVSGCMPVLHGSQGCATYIRRYLISHFREPADIASSNFVEAATVFGGRENFHTCLDNVVSQYAPEVIGVATTCLAETIGDDVPMFLREYRGLRPAAPRFILASTPSYSGDHLSGFHAAVKAMIADLTAPSPKNGTVNIFPSMCSPEDLRGLRDTCADYGLRPTMIPDYSDTLDGTNWDEYHRLPEGGTTAAAIAAASGADASVSLGGLRGDGKGSAAKYLESHFGVPAHCLPLPIGVGNCDRLHAELAAIAVRPAPEVHRRVRGRLLDSYVDAHKYLFDLPVGVYGDEDFVTAMVSFLDETGVRVVFAASGGGAGAQLESAVAAARRRAGREVRGETIVRGGLDFAKIEELAAELKPEIMIGNSKGYRIARGINATLVRRGFPVHDRLGAQRLKTLGYDGTQQLFDDLVNAVLARRQDESPVGYSYM